VFGVILGTGVGGGIVSDGKPMRGPNGLAGEWGHTCLEPDGPACYCGRRGCVELFLSGPALEAAYLAESGRSLPLFEIGRLPDDAARIVLQAACSRFGRALATVVNVLDPDVIVLGGGAGQLPQWRTWGLEALRSSVFGPDFVTPVLLPELGDSAGVLGAALLS
jgi:fructokinase